MSELGDELNYCYRFGAESKADLQVMAAMLYTPIRNSFISSCPDKTVQDKCVWWTNELSKLGKNTRRKLMVALCWNEMENWESYHKA